MSILYKERLQSDSTKEEGINNAIEGEIVEDIDVANVEEYLRITTEGKMKITLKETNKVKEVKMISIDSKKVDNIHNKIKVVNIDEVNKIIVGNEDMIDTDEAISIDNKEEMEIRTNVEEASNLDIKSRATKIVDKEDISDVVEIEKVYNISVKGYFGSASNQNTDNLSCLPDSINNTHL